MVINTDVCRELEEHPEKVEAFFRIKHPGIIPDLLSAESATKQLVNHQHISLKLVKCGTFGYRDSAVLLGDSSHTMTPFHAMGMITGLEDVRIFFEEFLDRAHRRLPFSSEQQTVKPFFCPAGVVEEYTNHRRPDVQAMTDMAAEHYHELRIGVRSRANRAKKLVESTLLKYAPVLDWATLYWRIQFGHERFSVIRKKEDQQKRIIKSLAPCLFFFLTWLATSIVLFPPPLTLGQCGEKEL